MVRYSDGQAFPFHFSPFTFGLSTLTASDHLCPYRTTVLPSDVSRLTSHGVTLSPPLLG